MRILINQTNRIETTPILDISTGTPLTTLTVEATVFDGVTELDSISLLHTSGGVYVGTFDVIPELEDDKEYTFELVVKQGSTNIWYFKGPVKAVIRDVQE